MFQLDLHSRIPIYRQLKDRILQLVMLGSISPGDPLPSVRVMARDLGINPNTVAKAYQDLEKDGFIYSVAGKGSFISGEDSVDIKMKLAVLEKLRQLAREAVQTGITEKEVISEIENVYGRHGYDIG